MDHSPATARGRKHWWWLLPVGLIVVLGVWQFSNDTGFGTSAVSIPPTTTLAALPEVRLTNGGIEGISFGDPVEDLHARLSDLLGSPDVDSAQPCVDGQETDRWIRWGNLTTISDTSGFRSFVHGVFFPALTNPTPIEARTDEGLTLGMSVAELEAAYAGQVEFGEPYAVGGGEEVRAFGIDGYDFYESKAGIGGYLRGDLETGTVITIVGGLRCPTLRDLRPT